MMRNNDVYGLAVRRRDNSIVACRRPWISFFPPFFYKVPFLRGFPVLLETIYNGIGALNRSAVLLEDEESTKLSRWQLMLSMVFAIAMAVLLFVVAPHALSYVMYALHAGGDVEGFSFHLWDGFYKMCIFFGYVWIISFLPEIRRVFCYHGAEHKTIHAFEKVQNVSASTVLPMSRFHPRCGTTFLLFVISLSIILHAVFVPIFLYFTTPSDEITKHILTVCFKILLIIPISAISYEIIKAASKLKKGFAARLLQAPGLFLQRLTTKEPDYAQVEVAVVALYVALDHEDQKNVVAASYDASPNVSDNQD